MSVRRRITLDEDLIGEIDRAASRLKMTRAAFIRQALANAITGQSEADHRRGYETTPEGQDEFSIWSPSRCGRSEARRH
jgi:metal-responsive CopG/Arc/MetJ family transcriptional regulator